MPQNKEDVALGFDNANAKYIGNDALNAVEFNRAQICFGLKAACADIKCIDFTDANIGGGVVANNYPGVSGLTGNMRKIIGGFTGQCHTSTGYSCEFMLRQLAINSPHATH